MPPFETFRPEPGSLPTRDAIPPRYKWDLTSICRNWDEWQGGDKAMDAMGALSYRVWYFAALHYDEDQRNNEINARRQQVQILFAKQQQASAWFNPEVLAVPLPKEGGWEEGHPGGDPFRLCR